MAGKFTEVIWMGTGQRSRAELAAGGRLECVGTADGDCAGPGAGASDIERDFAGRAGAWMAGEGTWVGAGRALTRAGIAAGVGSAEAGLRGGRGCAEAAIAGDEDGALALAAWAPPLPAFLGLSPREPGLSDVVEALL